MASKVSRDSVFVAGGQPSVTYVKRKQLDVERNLARALAAPNQIVALAGPTKSGKTVLCKHVLGERQYVWIDGGQVKTAADVWERVCSELNFPSEETFEDGSETKAEGGIKMVVSATGSQLIKAATKRTFRVDKLGAAINYLTENDIALVIDDFHYLDADERRTILRNLKGAVFKGLKVVLLSVTHRIFDVAKAEHELTGRFVSVAIPEWGIEDLKLIPALGFKALNVSCPQEVTQRLAAECQSSPFLMQKFCWEMCYDLGVDKPTWKKAEIPADIDLQEIFLRIAKDSGLPIYQQLVAGPEIRKDRLKRPLTSGGEADVYQAVLLAIAETGPESSISYNTLRGSLGTVLSDKIPQKNEVTSVLKQLSLISRSIGVDVGIDWDAEKRQLDISDPYLRFYLRWQVRRHD